MSKQISESRKAVFYIGTGLVVVGVLSFLSVFVTSIFDSGDFSNFASDMKSRSIRSLGGICLVVVEQAKEEL